MNRNEFDAIWNEHCDTCLRCHQLKENLNAPLFCTACERLSKLFPTGERNRQRRGHAFLTKTMVKTIPAMYATESIPLENKMIYVHYFVGGCDWYVAELDPETGHAFGLADLGVGCPEWGYFNLRELEQTVVNGWSVVERDLHFEPTTAREVGIG